MPTRVSHVRFLWVQGALVGELCSGWVASMERRLGLFGVLAPQTAQAQADTAKQPVSTHSALRPVLSLPQFVEGVESHCIWLVLLQESWQVPLLPMPCHPPVRIHAALQPVLTPVPQFAEGLQFSASGPPFCRSPGRCRSFPAHHLSSTASRCQY